ncbi:inversin isoform X2 [Ornithorhynchus anatinus]|uniref:inversin isoform X2 n=1 Tax=Ornithorhynchus anatinus TaxID=9258 RepID=UPI0010A91605|nr:inversin isoform X2 [Ornithorhynchus anatinus]
MVSVSPETGPAPIPEKVMSSSPGWIFSGSSLASQVHAAAVNGDKGALQKLIAGTPALKDKEDQFGRTPLMYCVLADRGDCAQVLLKAGADVNKADHSQRTALHLAAQKGNYRFMKLLLTRRANWMKKDLESMTPLHLSTRHKSPKCLALLLKFMAPGEVDTQDKNKQTALHWSAYYNNPEHVKLLIKHDSNIGIPDIEGKIPLHWAANHKDPSAIHTVRCILDAAPTESLLNWQDYGGRTALHFAVADGNLAVVDVLTSYGTCNVTPYDNLFRTPLHWAALLGHTQIVHLLLERNKFGTIPSDSQGATPLHYATQSNFAETVEVFLKHPSVKDDSDLEGRTSFMWAAGKGSDDVLRTMLSLKLDIDINMADKYGGTALHAAALSGHVSTVKLLLDHNAQVDATDVMKHTPLFRACEMGHKDVIQTLIKGGARVDLVDQDGHSPLHWAALGGNADVCQILIENKINPNVQDYAGRTPLQCAAYGGYIHCMAVLMENSADPNIQDKEGRTALHWSCNNGYLDAIKLLLDFAAFLNHMENNEERYTPLDYALLGEHHEVIQYMLEHGALSIAAIQDIAAFKIQAVYKGYKVRKAFQDRKNLLMKHEQLRRDAANKKREEENKRKHQGPSSPVACPAPANAETEARTREAPRLPGGPEAAPGPPARESRGESPGVPGGTTAGRERGLSPEPRGADRRKKKETFGKLSQSKYPCIHFAAKEGVEEDKPRPITAASVSEGDRGRGQQTLGGSGTLAQGNPRRDPDCRTARRRDATEDQRAANPPGGRTKRFPDPGWPDGGSGPPARPELPAKGKSSRPKGRSKELQGGRCSPAGSSRPGSAKLGVVDTRSDGARDGVQRSKLAAGECPGRVGPPPATAASPKQGTPAPCPLPAVGPAPAGAPSATPPGQGVNIELIPLERRLQIIEKERTRKELFQKKNRAATAIQRAWRRYRLRRQLSRSLGAQPPRKEDEDGWRRETAALFLQVAWKKELNRGPPQSGPTGANPNPRSRSGSAVKPSRQSVLKQIYGCKQEGKLHHPSKASKPKLLAAQQVPVNNLRNIHLLEDTGKSQSFSYNMRPATAVKGRRAKAPSLREKE